MWNHLRNGLEKRIGYRKWWDAYRQRIVPGGAAWSRATASCLLWTLVVLVATGVLLMSSYSPSVTDAWASVHHIEQSWAGSLLRGIHYFAAQFLIVLFVLHMMRVLIVGGYRAPRELIWITGLILVPLVLAWAITGNPLSGSQKGLSQIEVEGHIIASTPMIGRPIQRILIGGDQVGNLTLTHLYTLHVFILPLVVGVLLFLHISQIYRHGLLGPDEAENEPVPYWPFQTFRNMVVLALVMLGVTIAAWMLKAPHDVPASSELPGMPRPEWYFLSLFELRRYFSGDWEFIATMIIPAGILGLLLVMPLLDRWLSHRLSVFLRTGIVVVGLIAWGGLTAMPLYRDQQDTEYQRVHTELEELGDRAWVLANHYGVPPQGAGELLARDPKTQGPILFKRYCGSCHSHSSGENQGIIPTKPSAPNLYGIGTPDWIAGFLDPKKINGPHYFGNTAKADGEMVSMVESWFEDAESDDDRRQVTQQLNSIAWLLADQAGRTPKPVKPETLEQAKSAMVDEFGCTDCHRFGDEGELGSAPDLTGYASRDWLIGVIRNPNAERFYPDDANDRMPPFAPHEFGSKQNQLSRQQIELIVDWLRHEWYEPDSAKQ